VFFAQFLATIGTFDAFVADAPLSYASNGTFKDQFERWFDIRSSWKH
jgi:hypothetical protein